MADSAARLVGDILAGTLKLLDIPADMQAAAEAIYSDVGLWLGDNLDSDEQWNVYPQGSMRLGTVVRPQHIGLMFAVVVVPMTFLGCVYYPWAALHPIRWLQIGVLINPLVYMSEGLRAALTPGLPHMPVALFLVALTVAVLVLSSIGVRAFRRRTID
jgi:hypothetical protein